MGRAWQKLPYRRFRWSFFGNKNPLLGYWKHRKTYCWMSNHQLKAWSRIYIIFWRSTEFSWFNGTTKIATIGFTLAVCRLLLLGLNAAAVCCRVLNERTNQTMAICWHPSQQHNQCYNALPQAHMERISRSSAECKFLFSNSTPWSRLLKLVRLKS